MVKLQGADTYGWEAAIHGMRNPMNSWDKSDSHFVETIPPTKTHFVVGDEDLKLMKKLVAAGSDHRKFMRFITVYTNITAPLYWWKEFDTYKVGTVANSCSTMHKIHTKEFTLDDFSHEHLNDTSLAVLAGVIRLLNRCREKYLTTHDKSWWWQLIQLLPSSYHQKRTVMLNYEVLRNMYHARKNHKLDEWYVFCAWIQTLPHSELITEE